jgi:uncharacterized membrane protein (DUF2068 family)
MSASTTQVAPWEDFTLRLIAIYKLFHALFFTAVGFGLLRLKHHNVVEILNTYVVIPYHLNPENRAVDWMLDKAQILSPHLVLLGWAAFFYAALFAAEGIGLYRRKHWAEYLVVIVTASLLPLEVYELFVRLAWWKYVAVVGNLLIVGYLIHRLLLDARAKAQQKRDKQDKDKQDKQDQKKSPPSASARSKPVVNEVP